MKRYRDLLCLIALGSLVLAACGGLASPAPLATAIPTPTDTPLPTAPPADASALVGYYSLAQNDQKLLALSPDGWAYWPDNVGAYTVSGDQITFVDVWDCTEPGVYEWALDGTKLKLKAVGQDPCETRYDKTLTWWVKQPNVPYAVVQRLTDGHDLGSLAVDPQGGLYATKGDSLTVEKYGPDGSLQATLGGPGTEDGQFVTLGAMAADSQGNLYVSDPEGLRVVKFDATGKYLANLVLGTLAGPGPLGIAVDSQDNVYIGLLGLQDHYVEKWSADGRQLLTWGSRGTGDGQFRFTGPSSGPRGIAVDRQGNVYVTDPENNRVQKFDANGQFLLSLTGCGEGAFWWPYSVAVDGPGNLYVLDGLGHLFKCAATGQFLGLWLAPWSSSVRLDAAGNLFMLVAGDIAKIELPTP